MFVPRAVAKLFSIFPAPLLTTEFNFSNEHVWVMTPRRCPTKCRNEFREAIKALVFKLLTGWDAAFQRLSSL